MKKVLISACLVGDKVRYDGGDNLAADIADLIQHCELIPFCPEVEGGLSVPRKPSEIRAQRVYDSDGKDVTSAFLSGAEKALNICRYLHIEVAILKEASPSCGVEEIYNGHFEKHKKPGQGMTTRLLQKNGINVISEKDIPAFLASFKQQKKDVSD